MEDRDCLKEGRRGKMGRWLNILIGVSLHILLLEILCFGIIALALNNFVVNFESILFIVFGAGFEIGFSFYYMYIIFGR